VDAVVVAGLFHTAEALRTKPGAKQNYRKADNSADGIRKRRATANRVLTLLKRLRSITHGNRGMLQMTTHGGGCGHIGKWTLPACAISVRTNARPIASFRDDAEI
jgi:hypothetical protein